MASKNGFWAGKLRPGSPITRIVSTVPSQTELLHSLGLEKEVIAITLFCVHPNAWFRSKKRIGGTKKLNTEEILRLQPDCILANKEENNREQINELAQEVPVFVTDVYSVDSALQMIEEVGSLFRRDKEAENLVNEIEKRLTVRAGFRNKKAVYLIWKDPYMTVGGDTFIHDMMKYAGYENMLGAKERYPEVSIQQLKELSPGVLLLSSEPYPFKKEHVEELTSELPNTKVQLVNGEYFSWYGSRMLQAADYFRSIR